MRAYSIRTSLKTAGQLYLRKRVQVKGSCLTLANQLAAESRNHGSVVCAQLRGWEEDSYTRGRGYELLAQTPVGGHTARYSKRAQAGPFDCTQCLLNENIYDRLLE
jgi:hypothetical protein